MVIKPMSRAVSSARRMLRRAPGGRDGEEHVARPPKPAHLALEHVLEAVVVSHRREHRGVGGERHRRQRPAVDQITRQKFRRQMLRVGGAAAVTGDQELAAGAHGRLRWRARSRRPAAKARRSSRRVLQGRERPVEKAGEKIVVVRLSSHLPSLFDGAGNLPEALWVSFVVRGNRTFRRKRSANYLA